MQKLIFLVLFFPFIIYSPEDKISGTAKDNQHGGIESDFVMVLGDAKNLLTYFYREENGNYSLVLDNQEPS